MTLGNTLNDISSYSVSVLRGGRGLGAKKSAQRQPQQVLELYEYEGCPYCKKVRETLTELNIEYVSRSSARGSEKRNEVVAEGGKQQFPFLIDPSTDTKLYESEDIIDYLHLTYGKERSRAHRMLSPLNTASAIVASAARPRGLKVSRVQRKAQPEELLVLYNMEGSPYCRKVREVLCELDLDSSVKNVAAKGPRRDELVARGGRKTVPYLVDPNTNTEMYESDEIVEYLRSNYG